MSAEAVPGASRAMAAAARSRTADFVALTKPRLNLLVVATTAGGYYLGAGPGANVLAPGPRHARHGARRRRVGGVQPGDGAQASTR